MPGREIEFDVQPRKNSKPICSGCGILLSGDPLGELQSPYTQITLALENPDGSASNETFVIYEEQFDRQWSVDGGWL